MTKQKNKKQITKPPAVKTKLKKVKSQTSSKKTTQKIVSKNAVKKAIVKKTVKKVVPKKLVAAKVIKKSKNPKSTIKNMKFKKTTLKERMANKENKEVLVSLRNVEVTFGKGHNVTKAIDNLSFDIYRGEVFGLVGESGSGKSTTGNAILGLVNRVGGSIKVKKHEVPQKSKKVKGAERKYLVENVQMIFQDPASSLNPYKTIEKVVEEGLDNVDIKKVFTKSYDIETASVVIKIVENINSKLMKGLTLQHFVKMANEKEYDSISKLFINELMEEQKDNNNEDAILLKEYIMLREKRKNKILAKNKSKAKLKRSLVLDVIKSVGLSEASLNRYPLEFSGGQQQRVGISRALIIRPEILIADEPISALDVSIQAQVVNIFNELKDVFGITFLFIAHDLRMVEYISDRIAVMYKGKLLEIGTSIEIINNPVHPYTKSLTGSIPSIDNIKKSLLAYQYDARMHKYSSTNKPQWFEVSTQKAKNSHFVFASKNEITKWVKEVGVK